MDHTDSTTLLTVPIQENQLIQMQNTQLTEMQRLLSKIQKQVKLSMLVHSEKLVPVLAYSQKLVHWQEKAFRYQTHTLDTAISRYQKLVQLLDDAQILVLTPLLTQLLPEAQLLVKSLNPLLDDAQMLVQLISDAKMLVQLMSDAKMLSQSHQLQSPFLSDAKMLSQNLIQKLSDAKMPSQSHLQITSLLQSLEQAHMLAQNLYDSLILAEPECIITSLTPA